MRSLLPALAGLALLLAIKQPCGARAVPGATVPWKECLKQAAAWYKGEEASRIADQVLLYQRDTGGWAKNIDMAAKLTDAQRASIASETSATGSTIDNGATFTQMEFLARVYGPTKQDRYRTAFVRGLDYLFAAQYANGGWPQYYPERKGYYAHITFNDDAMIGVSELLDRIARREELYAFVDEKRRKRAEAAVKKGTACILACQVLVGGKKTAWCAQHDEKTLRPAAARAYEKVSLSGAESVRIVQLLMHIRNPGPDVVDAVQAAVAWLEHVKIVGIKQVRNPVPGSPKGYDTIVVAGAGTTPLWARFYEIETNRPIFCGRDGVIKYSLAEIEYERRNGYSWYSARAAKLLSDEYPAWQKRWAPGRSVLTPGAR